MHDLHRSRCGTDEGQRAERPGDRRLIIAALVILFIVINRTPTEVSFLFFTTVTMSLWVALTIAAVGGFIAGFLIGRKRYSRKRD